MVSFTPGSRNVHVDCLILLVQSSDLIKIQTAGWMIEASKRKHGSSGSGKPSLRGSSTCIVLLVYGTDHSNSFGSNLGLTEWTEKPEC